MLEDPYLLWLLAYVLPASLAAFSILYFRIPSGSIPRQLTVHGFLILSIILTSAVLLQQGMQLPYFQFQLTILLFLITLGAAWLLLGPFGMLYGVSAWIQEACLLSVTIILLTTFSPFFVALLVAPIFSLTHLLQPAYWYLKIPVTMIWGFITILTFAVHGDLYLNTALHTIAGALLISASILYPKTTVRINRHLSNHKVFKG